MSGFYNDGLESLLLRTIPFEASVYAVGVNDDYVYDAEHRLFEDFDEFVILPEIELVGHTGFNGVLDAPDTTWLAAGAGAPEGTNLELLGVIIYFKLDDAGTLFAFIDSATVGLPQSLTGVNVTARWHADGILKI